MSLDMHVITGTSSPSSRLHQFLCPPQGCSEQERGCRGFSLTSKGMQRARRLHMYTYGVIPDLGVHARHGASTAGWLIRDKRTQIPRFGSDATNARTATSVCVAHPACISEASALNRIGQNSSAMDEAYCSLLFFLRARVWSRSEKLIALTTGRGPSDLPRRLVAGIRHGELCMYVCARGSVIIYATEVFE